MEEEDHQKRISNTRRTIEDLKAELAKVGDQPDVTPRINAVNADLRRIQEERAKIEGEKGDLRREKDNLCAESRSELPKTICINKDDFFCFLSFGAHFADKSTLCATALHVDSILFSLSVLEKKLNDMNNMMNAKVEKLRGRHRDTHAALQWLRQNKQLFRGNVHEPMMLVVRFTEL